MGSGGGVGQPDDCAGLCVFRKIPQLSCGNGSSERLPKGKWLISLAG